MKTFELKNEKMNYILFKPKNINEKKRLPLIVYLHGAGERGTNIKNVYRHAIPEMIFKGKEIDAFVLCPQCPANCIWDNIVFDLKDLIDDIVKENNIDSSRISITGSSMGGFGAFAMAMTFNNFFSCVAPVAGGNMSWRSLNLKDLPVKMYHGDKDEAVPIIYSKLMYDKLKYINSDCELVIMEGYGHNDGIDHCYNDLDIYDYLLSHSNEGKQINEEFLHEMFK